MAQESDATPSLSMGALTGENSRQLSTAGEPVLEGSTDFPKPKDYRPLALLLVILVGASLFLFKYTATKPVYGDSIGYIYAGERIAQGHGPTYEDPNNSYAGPYFSLYAFQIRHDDDPRMFLGYPPGYPLLIAAGILVTGIEKAAHYVAPVFAMAVLAATFFLARLLSTGNQWVGVWAAVLLLSTPMFWEFGTAAWSEIPSTAFLVLGVALFVYSVAYEMKKSRKLLLSMAAGLLLSFSFFIRYSNVMIIPALLIFEVLSKKLAVRREPERWVFYGLLGAGVLAIPLFNTVYYGGPFTTSYSPDHGWYPYPPFSIDYMLGPSFVGGRSLIEAVKTLWLNFPVLLLVVPAGWLLLPKPSGALTGLAILGFTGLYSLYAFAPTGINGRFLIPTLPFIAISAAQWITFVGDKVPYRSARRIAGAALLLLLFLRFPGQMRAVESAKEFSEAHAANLQNIAALSEPEAVMMSYVFNDNLAYFGHRSVLNYRRIPRSLPEVERFEVEMLEPCLVESIDRLQYKGIPVYFIEDQSPTYWNSLAILQDNYQLEVVSETPITYKIMSPAGRTVEVDPSAPFSCGEGLASP